MESLTNGINVNSPAPLVAFEEDFNFSKRSFDIIPLHRKFWRLKKFDGKKLEGSKCRFWSKYFWLEIIVAQKGTIIETTF